jgi:hypothetical protein
MLFTAAGLEQATHEAVAEYHATRFPAGALVADLTTGIGADLIALCERGPAVGFELDEEARLCALHNTRGCCEIHLADSLSAEWGFEYAFADPARRDSAKRLADPEMFEPNPLALAERMRTLKFAGMKLSPMLADDYLLKVSPCIEFISFGGECREAVAWFGDREGVFARHIDSGGVLENGGVVPKAAEPAAYIYEADPAAIRAHCLPALCKMLDANSLGESNGYLTGATLAENEWVRAYRVIEFGAFDVKRVRAILDANGGGTPEIKTRAKVDVPKLRKQLATRGTNTPLIALYPVQKSIRFALLERI